MVRKLPSLLCATGRLSLMTCRLLYTWCGVTAGGERARAGGTQRVRTRQLGHPSCIFRLWQHSPQGAVSGCRAAQGPNTQLHTNNAPC
jgi:hypothetical protein